jgi:chloramphenicol-sensitive protein RarD
LPLAIAGFAIALAGPGITFGRHGLGNAALLLLTGPVTAVPLVLFAYAAHRIPLTLVGLLLYLTPVGQLLCGVLAFHEAVPVARLAGFALVWAALVILTFDAVRHYRNEASMPVPVDA